MRLVVDTNLMIRALLSPGPARQFFKLAPLIHHLIYHSEQWLELRDVAARPRLGISISAIDEDQDLLVLDPWQGIRIMRLSQFLVSHPLPNNL